MQRIIFLLVGVAALALAADDPAVPAYVTKIPAGYRDWKLISVAHEEGSLHSLGAMLGNDIAIKAYREGKLPFPDGTIIAALHYTHVPSEENDKVFGQKQSFVPGAQTNVQFMVKDSAKYAATGGWGFGFFKDGKPMEAAAMKSCFPCHNEIKARDLVFTRYAQ
jgi:Cytochrome P460